MNKSISSLLPVSCCALWLLCYSDDLVATPPAHPGLAGWVSNVENSVLKSLLRALEFLTSFQEIQAFWVTFKGP